MRVIIAEDEKWVRLAIIKQIPFEKLALTLAGEASNGYDALEICKQHKPDILITDIRMPGMSGLELIEKVKGILPKLKIIIISGYKDFEYVKAAMKFGVTDYILKPVDEKDLTQIIQKHKDSIELENKQYEEQSLIISRYKSALPYEYESFFNQITLTNLLPVNSIFNALKNYGICFDLPYFTIVVFLPDDISMLNSSSNFKKYKLTIKRIMRRYLKSYTFSKSSIDYEIAAIVNHNALLDSDSLIKTLSLCSSIYKKYFAGTLSIGISSTAQNIKKLPELYSEAYQALNTRFWNGAGKIHSYFQTEEVSSDMLEISDETFDNILLYLTLSDLQSAFSQLDCLFGMIKKSFYLSPSVVIDFFWTFVQQLSSKLNLYMPFMDYETCFFGIHPYEKIRSAAFIEDLSKIVKEMLNHLCKLYHEKNLEGKNSVIETAKIIIRQNFARDITLEQVAKQVYLSPTYFSELFKKETGMSFIDYKVNLRIENAKKLLSSTNYNISEISDKVGYNDSKYFSKLFKRITGMTFNEFRKNE